MGDDSFSFPGFGDTVGNGLTNPLIYHFNQRWPVRLVCFLFVRNYFELQLLWNLANTNCEPQKL